MSCLINIFLILQPIFVRQDSSTAFIGRVRNLPYPIETYNVTVDDDKKNIIIRTTNKK
jgi:hypothetical protein